MSKITRSVGEQQIGKGKLMDLIKQGLNVVKHQAARVGIAPRIGLNNVSTRTLAQLGNYQITSIKIARAPIQKWIGYLADAISRGQWNNAKRQLGYDQLVHLSIRAIVNNTDVLIEKNAVPEITTKIPNSKNTEYMLVPITHRITLNEFINNGIKHMGMANFMTYSANSLNCQHFIINLLIANKMSSPTIRAFIVQDIESIFSKLPEYMKVIANTLTYTGSVADKMLGRGKKAKKKV